MNGSEATNGSLARPVLLPVTSTRRRSSATRQRYNSCSSDAGGETPEDAQKTLQMWLKLQEEREQHEQANERERQLQLAVTSLKEHIEEKQTHLLNQEEQFHLLSQENQQLKQHTEEVCEQLKAGNKQLQACQEQTKACQEQLRACQEQLRASEEQLTLKEVTVSQQATRLGDQGAKLIEQDELIKNYVKQADEHGHVIKDLEEQMRIVDTRYQEQVIKLEEARIKYFEYDVAIQQKDQEIAAKAVEIKLQSDKLTEYNDKLFIQDVLKNTLSENEDPFKCINEEISLNGRDVLLTNTLKKNLIVREEIISKENMVNDSSIANEIQDFPLHNIDNVSENQLNLLKIERQSSYTDAQHQEFLFNELLVELQEKDKQIFDMRVDLHQKEGQLTDQEQQLIQKDQEVRRKELQFKHIEEKINQFEVKLTIQSQDLKEQVELNGNHQQRIETQNAEIDFISKKLRKQCEAIREQSSRLQLCENLEKELKVKDIVSEASSLDVKQQLDTLQAYCEHLLQQQENSLMVQVKLESRLQDQVPYLEASQKEISNRDIERQSALTTPTKMKLIGEDCHLEKLDNLKKILLLQQTQLKENEEVIDEKDLRLNSLTVDLLQDYNRIEELVKEQNLKIEAKDVQLEKTKVQFLRIEELEEELKKETNVSKIRYRELEKMKQELLKIRELEIEIEQRKAQIQLQDEELVRNNVLLLDLNQKLEMYELKQELELAEAAQVKEEESKEKTQLLEHHTRLLKSLAELQRTLEDKDAKLAELQGSQVEKDGHHQVIQTLLEALTQEKYEQTEQINFLKKSLDDQNKEVNLQDQALQRQDKFIQRLQQQVMQLEQDIMIQQQDSLKQQQDLMDESVQTKEILQQQLLKQTLLLQQQDLKLHYQDETAKQSIASKNKFLSWGAKKK